MTGLAPPIDFAAVAERADLRRLVEEAAGPSRNGLHFCPWHGNTRTPALSVYRDAAGAWRWKCHGCGLGGDALDWVMHRDGLASPIEAARALEPDARTAPQRRRPATRARPAPRPARPAAWREPGWQAAVDQLVELAGQALWGPGGRDALGWLRGRGLEDHTIRRFRLGFIASEGWTAPATWPDGTASGIHHERGILIPWPAPGGWFSPDEAPDGPRWCGVNVRRLMPDPFAPLPADEDKCRALRGSERGHLYPWPDILPSQGIRPALIVEGEFDAILGHQEAGHVLQVGTVGGANQTPRSSALAALALCPWWLVATDHDAAGVEAALAWRERAPHKARRALLPEGKDLSDFHVAGGDVAGWLAAELARLGIAGTGGVPETTEP